MGAWNNTLLLGSTLIATGVAGLLLRRDGRSGLVCLSIAWLGLPILIGAARLLHPDAATTASIPVLLAVLSVYLVLGAGLRDSGLDETEVNDVDGDVIGGDVLADRAPLRDWSTELMTGFQQGTTSGAGRPGEDGRPS